MSHLHAICNTTPRDDYLISCTCCKSRTNRITPATGSEMWHSPCGGPDLARLPWSGECGARLVTPAADAAADSYPRRRKGRRARERANSAASRCTLLLYKALGVRDQRFENLSLTWCGAMGTRTPGLLHAMNHPPVPRPGHMWPDQARRQLTLAAAGSEQPSPAAFCPSNCPSK